MEISFSTIPGNLRLDIGYGYAGFNVIRSLQQLGHKVPYDSPKSPVQIHFSQPNWYRFHRNQYKIGYTPWESTSLPGKDWKIKMNETDELWTTSEFCKEVFLDCGINVPIYVYKHGLNPVFTPVQRNVTGPMKFLHIGHPSPRKDALMAVSAFREAFGDSEDVHLTIKAYRKPGSDFHYNNVTTVEGSVSTDDLVALYHSHHAFVYPSWGEGFGMTPLEALGTGMPVICTEAWAPYKEYIIPLESKLAQSPWPKIHQGNMFRPNHNHLVHLYRELYENYTSYATAAFEQTDRLQKEYNWLDLTASAFEHIVEKFS